MEIANGVPAGRDSANVTLQTLSAAAETVAEGYYEATTLSTVDADLAVANIKTGVVIFGKTGTYDVEAVNPITAGLVQTGKIGFVNGGKVTGNGTKTLSDANTTVAAGYYAATTLEAVDADLAVGNIAVGKTIFGLAGTYTSDANAVAADIATGKTAYVNGVKITGNHA
jgi:hypothetical protein